MDYKREINFTTTPSTTRLTEGKVCYQGRLQHNQVLDVAETRRLFAKHVGEQEPRVNCILDALGTFMQRRIAEGHRVNFGPFAMGLKLCGGFQSANAPFDENSNSVGVVLTPGVEIKKAAAALKPINVTCARSRITCVMQETPPCAEYGTIDASGTRNVYVATNGLWVHSDVEGEGVWLEDDLGHVALTGTVTSSQSTRTFVTFTADVAPGQYWLVARGRHNGPELLSARRRITVAG